MEHYYYKEAITKYILKNPRIISYEECTFYGHWFEKEFKLNNKFNLGAITESIGDSIEINFNGKYIGLMAILSNKSVTLECLLDDKFAFNLDLYMNSEGHFSTLIDLKDIGEGNHNLLMKVINKKTLIAQEMKL